MVDISSRPHADVNLNLTREVMTRIDPYIDIYIWADDSILTTLILCGMIDGWFNILGNAKSRPGIFCAG